MLEFTNPRHRKDVSTDVLGQVVSYLEEARMWDNVSSFFAKSKFEVDRGWDWDWNRMFRSNKKMEAVDKVGPVDMAAEGGGVKLR